MRKEETPDLQPVLADALRKLTEQMGTLATLNLVREFYTKSERMRLYAEYESLLDEEKKAKRAVNESRPKDGLSDEARVKMLGDEAARQVTVSIERANAAALEVSNKIFRFGMEHAVIVDVFLRKTKNAASR